MNTTPASNRKHILLLGETNAGKSSLFNALLGQPRAIVSDQPGTTTDPVLKSMELLPYGPVTLVDTAGLFDESELGNLRETKTRKWLYTADLALYVNDPGHYDAGRFKQMIEMLKKHKLPYLVVWMKTDVHAYEHLPEGYAVSVYDLASIHNLLNGIVSALATHTEEEKPLIGGLIPGGGVVVLIATADSAAPAKRLILPQSQLIRECLERGIRCHVTPIEQLQNAVKELPRIDLAVTDSQIFPQVNGLLPLEIPLTSFSILVAQQKGNFNALYQGALAVLTLQPGDRVLVSEACTHTVSHEDIGQVKIPNALKKLTGGTLTIDFAAGKEFPDDVSGYKLIVHCGGCMLTPRAFTARQEMAAKQGAAFTNYGMVLALAAGVLERSAEMFL